jgi:hypothetical protein
MSDCKKNVARKCADKKGTIIKIGTIAHSKQILKRPYAEKKENVIFRRVESTTELLH